VFLRRRRAAEKGAENRTQPAVSLTHGFNRVSWAFPKPLPNRFNGFDCYKPSYRITDTNDVLAG